MRVFDKKRLMNSHAVLTQPQEMFYSSSMFDVSGGNTASSISATP